MAETKVDDTFRQYQNVKVLYVDGKGNVFFSPSAKPNLRAVYRKIKKTKKTKKTKK